MTSDRFGFEPELTARLAQARARVWEIGISYSGRTYARGEEDRLARRRRRDLAHPAVQSVPTFMMLPWSGLSSTRRRVIVAIAIGLGAFLLSELHLVLPKPGFSDFVDPWLGARMLVQGYDPYAVVRSAHPDVALYYPLPALLVILPLGWLTLVHAQSIFVGLGMAVMAYAGWNRKPLLIGCVSAGALSCVISGQWSPIMTASALLPMLGFMWAAKPSLGLALAVGYANRPAIIGALALTAISFLVWPTWVTAWLPGLHGSPHVAPAARPGGFVLLAALLRWRRPEGRMLAVLSCIPQTTMLYDTVPLFLIPSTRPEAYLLAILTQVAAVVIAWRRTDLPLVQENAHQWPVLLLLVYLPALIMLLRLPNVPHSDPVIARHPERDSPQSRLQDSTPVG